MFVKKASFKKRKKSMVNGQLKLISMSFNCLSEVYSTFIYSVAPFIGGKFSEH